MRLRPTSARLAKAAEWSAWIDAEHRAWRMLERRDPFLPAALLPADYAGRTVWQARVEALRASGLTLADAVAGG